MSEVLGVVIKGVLDSYQTLCTENGIKDKSLTTSLAQNKVKLLRRYPWSEFIETLESATTNLANSGVSTLELQGKIIPGFFRRMVVARISGWLFSPSSLMKLVNTYEGPFLFRCGTSKRLGDFKTYFGYELRLDEHLGPSKVFMENCIAGNIVMFETMNWLNFSISEFKLSSRSLRIIFHFPDEVETTIPPASGEIWNLRVALLYLDDFEIESCSQTSTAGKRAFSESINLIYAAIKFSACRAKLAALNLVTCLSVYGQRVLADQTNADAKQQFAWHRQKLVDLLTGEIKAIR